MEKERAKGGALWKPLWVRALLIGVAARVRVERWYHLIPLPLLPVAACSAALKTIIGSWALNEVKALLPGGDTRRGPQPPLGR